MSGAWSPILRRYGDSATLVIATMMMALHNERIDKK